MKRKKWNIFDSIINDFNKCNVFWMIWGIIKFYIFGLAFVAIATLFQLWLFKIGLIPCQ